MKNLILLVTFIVVPFSFLACTSEEGAPPATPKDHFSMNDFESLEALSKAGCDARNDKVSCGEVLDVREFRDEDYEIKNLENKKSVLEERIKAVEAFMSELKVADEKEWSSSSTTRLMLLGVSASTLKASLISEKAGVEVDLVIARNYKSYTGFQCQGLVGIDEADTNFQGSLALQDPEKPAEGLIEFESVENSEESWFKKIFNSYEDIPSNMEVSLRNSSKTFRLVIGSQGSPVEAAEEMKLLSAQSDGEFKVNWSKGPFKAKDVTCLKQRILNMNPEEMTQKIIESRSYKCVNYTTKPKVGEEGVDNLGFNDETLRFHDDASFDDFFGYINFSIDGTYDEHPWRVQGYRYLWKVSNERGKIVLTLVDMTDASVMAVFETTNRAKVFGVLFLDEGFGAGIKCEELVN